MQLCNTHPAAVRVMISLEIRSALLPLRPKASSTISSPLQKLLPQTVQNEWANVFQFKQNCHFKAQKT